MKYLKILALCTVLAMSATSCNDYLEVESPSKFDDSYVFASENEIFRAVTGIYYPVGLVYGQRWATAFNSNNDVEFNDVSDTPSAKGSDFASFEPKTHWTDISDVWAFMYQGINEANLVISGIENGPLFGAADKKQPSNLMQLYGEAKTLRAMMYLDLVRTWGDVPFMTKPTAAGDDFEQPATDRDEILTYLIKDLKEIEPLMKYAGEISYGAERASRSFCQGLITIMALTRGGYSLRPDVDNPSAVGSMVRPDDWKEYYKIAEEYSYKLIKSGKHQLGIPFRQMWINECSCINPIPDNDDIVFDVPLVQGGVGEYGYYVGIPIDASWNGSTGTGTNPWGKASGSYNLSTFYMMSFDKEDLRRDMTCALYRYDSSLNQNKITMGAGQMGGVKAAKYCRLYSSTPFGESSSKSPGINCTYMRYADVLLMYAEAANENNGKPTEEAKEALKAVRRRAFPESAWSEKVDGYVDALNDKDSFFEAIVDERAWEFGGEGKRRFDLVRWNLYGKVVKDMFVKAREAGRYANGLGGKDHGIPDKYWWYQVDNPERPGTKMIKFVGLFEPAEKPTSQETGGAKVNEVKFGLGLWNADDTPTATLTRCFRGYLTPETVDGLDPERTPVRYLLPYSQLILSQNKKLKNYYGFN